ncbi:hypothetical protein BCR34DRAFT_254406 [Clohesyomyces aquaticus]|uniref:Uncharacterized protein n=1 Tax=Clohesyomyces aquaticus TaxID=1231657 RepID=A0A1Y1ZV68_9PLEO|nr:hypothetical protein BCR34DRAFT_254406 [Clohesyomyces aquaticus]
MNWQMFNVVMAVMAIHQILSRLPPSIDGEQLVLLTDSFEGVSPLHLEFIQSRECLMAVLRIHFEEAGVNTQKLDREDFVVEEPSARRRIDLTKD